MKKKVLLTFASFFVLIFINEIVFAKNSYFAQGKKLFDDKKTEKSILELHNSIPFVIFHSFHGPVWMV